MCWLLGIVETIELQQDINEWNDLVFHLEMEHHPSQTSTSHQLLLSIILLLKYQYKLF